MKGIFILDCNLFLILKVALSIYGNKMDDNLKSINSISDLVNAVTELLKKNEIASAIQLYNKHREDFAADTSVQMLNKKMEKVYDVYNRAVKQQLYEKRVNSYIENKTEMVSFYKQFINEGNLCFDIGANVGNRAVIFEYLGGEVVCVEPQETCVKVLRELFETRENVHILQMGVGAEEGTATLYICNHMPVVSTMSEQWIEKGRFSGEYANATKQAVPLTTLDRLISTYGIPSFCKIDVEGFEYEVLKGLSQPVPSLSFEFHEEFFDRAEECISLLGNLGSYQYNFSIEESMDLYSRNWLSPDLLFPSMRAIKQEKLWGDIYARLVTS